MEDEGLSEEQVCAEFSQKCLHFNSLDPGRYGSNFKSMIFQTHYVK